MKAAKKQNKNSSAPKIQTFFKSAPKSFVVEEKPDNPRATTKDFYIEILKSKLKDIEDNPNGNNLSSVDVGDEPHSNEVIQDIDGEQTHSIKLSSGEVGAARYSNEVIKVVNAEQSKSNNQASFKCAECARKDCERKELEQKLKEMTKRYFKLTAAYSEVQLKLNDLENVIITTDRVVDNNNDIVASSGEIFTPNEVRALQAIPLKKENDSTFMLRALEYAYKADASLLKTKTLIGKPEWVEVKAGGEEIKHATKDALTPTKVDRVKQLFIERITKCKIDSVTYGERIKDAYANKLIGNGIKNISRRQK